MNHNTTLLFIKKYDLGEGIMKTAYFSDDDPQPDFIDIAIAYPFIKFNVEITTDYSLNDQERLERVNCMADGIFKTLSYFYNDGDYLEHRKNYETQSVGRDDPQFYENYKAKMVKKATGFFQQEDVSVSLIQRIEKLIDDLLLHGEFDYVAEYPESFIRMSLQFMNPIIYDLNVFEDMKNS